MYEPPVVCATYAAVNAPLPVLTSGAVSQVHLLQAAAAGVIVEVRSHVVATAKLSHRDTATQPIVRLATSHEWRSSRHSSRIPERRRPVSLPAREGTSCPFVSTTE